MININIWQTLKEGGFVLVPYTMLKVLGPINSVVLGEIVSELNHAIKNHLSYNQDFLTNINRMADFLGMQYQEVISAVKELQEQALITVSNSYIKNTIYMVVNIDKILELQENIITEYLFCGWDSGLMMCQNPTHEKTSFTNSLNRIKIFIEENAKDLNPVPMIVYMHLNSIIKIIERKQERSIFEVEPFLYEKIKEQFLELNENSYNLISLFWDILSAIQH